MDNPNHNQGRSAADDVVGDLKKDFTIVGKQRVHSWYAWAIVGIVFGMALGIIYVANRSGQFDPSRADEGATAVCPKPNPDSRPHGGYGYSSEAGVSEEDYNLWVKSLGGTDPLPPENKTEQIAAKARELCVADYDTQEEATVKLFNPDKSACLAASKSGACLFYLTQGAAAKCYATCYRNKENGSVSCGASADQTNVTAECKSGPVDFNDKKPLIENGNVQVGPESPFQNADERTEPFDGPPVVGPVAPPAPTLEPAR